MKKGYYWIVAIVVILIIVLLVILNGDTGQESSSDIEPDISWSEAIELLNSGEVDHVWQYHDFRVELILKNGTTLTTLEPEIDNIIYELEKCGDKCKDLVLGTE